MMTAEVNHSNLNSFAAMMYIKMEEVAREKYAGYTVHLVDKWPTITALECECILGAMVITSIPTQQRWMMKKDAVPFADTWVTSADLARLYLNLRWKGVKRRITTLQWKEFYETFRSMPLFALPCQIENAYYVDIKAAYWSILRAVGWNVDYMPSRWLKVSDTLTVNDFPFSQNKMARNCLVSLAADGSKLMRVWTGDKLEYRKGGNSLVNKMLYAFVCDVLNGVALECVGAGAVYAFTDGFIVPEEKVEEIEAIISAWGFRSGIKHFGACEIKGVGAYRFPDYKTAKFDRQHAHAVTKISAVNTEWLRPRLKFFSDRNGATLPFDEGKYVSRLLWKSRSSVSNLTT